MAEIYIHAKRYDDAFAMSDEALVIDPNNVCAEHERNFDRNQAGEKG
jgi:hypothetical protein